MREIGHRDEVGSFSPRLTSASSFRPLPGRKRLSLNYGRGARLNFAKRTKRRFKLNACLFRLRQSRPYTCATLLLPSAAVSNPSLSLGVSWGNPYSSFRLLRFAVAFKSGCLSPGPFSTTPVDSPTSRLSFLRRVYEGNDRRVKDRKRERENRTYYSYLRFHPLSLATPRILGIPLGIPLDYEIPARGNYLPQIFAS